MIEEIGINRKSAKKMLEDFQKQKVDLQRQMADMHIDPYKDGIPMEYIKLQDRLRLVDETMVRIRDWYGVGVLESLETETRTLKWLTVILITLTIVLAVFTGFLVSGIKLP